jgi:DnaJ-domain-containing protein 1
MSRSSRYYQILGVNSTATQDEIKAAYKKAALKWHPDRNTNNTEVATKKFKEVGSVLLHVLQLDFRGLRGVGGSSKEEDL